MYWSACSSTCDSRSLARSDARHLDDLGDGGVAADRHGDFAALGAGALHRAANGFADGFRIDDGLFVDGVLRRRLGRIGLDPVLPARLGKLDELDRGSRDIETQQGGRYLRLSRNIFYFLFNKIRPKAPALRQFGGHYITAQS